MVSTLAARPTRPSRRSDGMSAISGTRSRGFWFFLIPGLLLFTFIILIPLVWNVFLSFTEYRGIRPPEFIGLENWIELLGDAKFWASFRNSLAMIVAMVIIPTLLGLVLAALLFDVIGRKFGGRVASFLRATYYLPQILPVAIAGDRDRLDPPPRERRAQHGAREHRPRRAGAQLARRPRHRAGLDHGRHGLGADRLPRGHLHGRAAAGRPRAVRGGRARRRRLVPAVPVHHRERRSGPRSSS